VESVESLKERMVILITHRQTSLELEDLIIEFYWQLRPKEFEFGTHF